MMTLIDPVFGLMYSITEEDDEAILEFIEKNYPCKEINKTVEIPLYCHLNDEMVNIEIEPDDILDILSRNK